MSQPVRFCLISPRSIFISGNEDFQSFWWNTDSLSFLRSNWSGISSGLLVVASLAPSDWDIRLLDENISAIDFDEPVDLVGITSMTCQAKRAYEIADQFRSRGAKVVLGGIHPTLMPEEAKIHADAVVVGEVENIWDELQNDFQKGVLKSVYKSDRPVVMAESPCPRFDLIPQQTPPVIWIQSSRGCPFDCFFCAASKIYGPKYRRKPNALIIEELRKVKEKFPRPHLAFADDNFFVNHKEVSRLLTEMLPLKLRWFCMADITISENEELLKLARAAGCHSIFIGLESLSAQNLDGLDARNRKLSKLSHYSEAVEKIQNLGIGVFGAFIVGFDEDTEEVFDSITKFVIENKLLGAQISSLTPYPGTRLREKVEAEGRILTNDWSRYTFFDVVFQPKRMSPETLQRGIFDFFKTAYSDDVVRLKRKHFLSIYKNLDQSVTVSAA
jgi:radical SAM superfamily enzyme YgiQ (UPF0313 family)